MIQIDFTNAVIHVDVVEGAAPTVVLQTLVIGPVLDSRVWDEDGQVMPHHAATSSRGQTILEIAIDGRVKIQSRFRGSSLDRLFHFHAEPLPDGWVELHIGIGSTPSTWVVADQVYALREGQPLSMRLHDDSPPLSGGPIRRTAFQRLDDEWLV